MGSLARLRQLADNFASASAYEYPELALACRELGENHSDTRYSVLAECFQITSSYWGDGEAGAVATAFFHELVRIWQTYLPGILRAETTEDGVALAQALRSELSVLAANDPLMYPDT